MFFQDTSGCADLLIQTKYDTMNLDTKKMLLIPKAGKVKFWSKKLEQLEQNYFCTLFLII
jgi:hypothetical protein